MDETKLLKESINNIINRLGLTSRWKDITWKVFGEFVKDGLEDSAENFNRLKDNIRKTLQDDSRKNIQLLTKVKSALEETDHISILCQQYMKKFRNNEFFIPENDVKEIREKANNGHKLAQRALGEYYLNGGNFGIPNWIDAHHYFCKAFEQYDWISALYLAKIYSKNPFLNQDIANSYYEYALLFYFEGEKASEYIPLNGKMKFSNYVKEKAYSILAVLNNLANDSILLTVKHLRNNEKLPYLIKKTELSQFAYLLHKFSELYDSDIGISIRQVFKNLLAHYYLYDDESYFIVSTLGSICGETSALYYLACAFKDGRGIQQDLTPAIICYTLLLYLGENTEWQIRAMQELTKIYEELKQTEVLEQQSEAFALLKVILQK